MFLLLHRFRNKVNKHYQQTKKLTEIKTKIILTAELLKTGMSSNNGWSIAQVNALGEHCKQLERGWMRRLIGKEITQEQYDRFIELKDAHLKPKNPAVFNQNQQQNQYRKKPIKVVQKPAFHPITGHMTMQEQYRHPNWQIMKNIILSRDNFACVNCGGVNTTLHVHHLKYGNTYVLDVPVWYLVTLCEACHSEEHGRNVGFK